MTTSIAVLGAGAWGSALATHLCRRADLLVTLWSRDAEFARALVARRTNEKYLPGVVLPDALLIASDLAATADASLLIAGTPVAALPESLQVKVPVTTPVFGP